MLTFAIFALMFFAELVAASFCKGTFMRLAAVLDVERLVTETVVAATPYTYFRCNTMKESKLAYLGFVICSNNLVLILIVDVDALKSGLKVGNVHLFTAVTL